MMTKTMQKYDENELAAKMMTTQWRQWTQLCFLPHTGADIVDYIVENIFDSHTMCEASHVYYMKYVLSTPPSNRNLSEESCFTLF